MANTSKGRNAKHTTNVEWGVANASSRRSDYSTLKKPDLQPNAHKPGYKWDAHMQIWYKPITQV